MHHAAVREARNVLSTQNSLLVAEIVGNALNDYLLAKTKANENENWRLIR